MAKLATVTDVSDCNTINMVLNKSGTAWEPISKELAAVTDSVVDSMGYHAIIRPDTKQILGICSKRYKPNSHVVHLARLDNMVRTGDLKPERVSTWDQGSLMAFQFRATALDVAIMQGDIVSPLLTLAFYNDGKHGDMSFFADFRWACTNQLGKVAKAMEGNKRVAHRGDVSAKYEVDLQSRITEMREQTAGRYDTMKAMVDRQLQGRGLLAFFASSLALSEESVDELLSNKEKPSQDAKALQVVLSCHREDQTNAPGSVWHAYNAVTRYLTHQAGRNGATRSARALLGGAGVGFMQKVAFEEAAKLV